MGEREKRDELRSLREDVVRLRKAIRILTPSLDVLLRRRGFSIYKKEPGDDLLMPDASFVDRYYEVLKRYSFRLFLRDVITHQPLFTLPQVTRYATREVTAEYISFLVDIGMAARAGDAYTLTKGRIRSFGETLEWFISEILRREFLAEVAWGVRMKKPAVGGDYDLLAKLDGSILYMEVKSSPPKQIYQAEIRAFCDRVAGLSPEMAVFFVDTELRMKDKIVPMFEEEMKERGAACFEARRIQKELFEIRAPLGGSRGMCIINAKDSIIHNLQTVIGTRYRDTAQS